MTPEQARTLAQQCVNCLNLYICKTGGWVVVWEGDNCANFMSKEVSNENTMR